jgi:ectoine hydroxylase-related dioxygenase (phytanoyl-CoA dioxygenase family)
MSSRQDAADGCRVLTPDEVASFRERGYARVERLVSPDFANMLFVAAERLAADFNAEGGALKSARPEPAREADFASVRKAGALARMWRNLPDPTPNEQAFWNFSHSPRLAHVASQLLTAPGPVRFYRNQLLVKQPAGDRGTRTPWHQDFPYLSFDRSERPSIWMALDHVTVDQGALRFVEGSHRFGSLGRMLDNGEEDVSTRFPDLFASAPLSPAVALAPGDAFVFHPLTIHGAAPNTTDRPRWIFLTQFVAADIRFTGARPVTVEELSEIEIGGLLDHPRFPVIEPLVAP